MCRKISKKIKETISHDGIFKFFKKCIYYLWDKIYWKYYVYETSIIKPIKKIRTPIDLTFRWADAKSLKSLNEELYEYHEKDKEYTLKQLEKGAQCFFALHDKQIVGYSWCVAGSLEISKYRLKLPDSKVYRFNTFVMEKFRGKRLLNAIESYGSDILRKNNKKIIVGFIHYKNIASIKGRERMGWQRIGEFISIRFFGERPLFELNYMPRKVRKMLESEPKS